MPSWISWILLINLIVALEIRRLNKKQRLRDLEIRRAEPPIEPRTPGTLKLSAKATFRLTGKGILGGLGYCIAAVILAAPLLGAFVGICSFYVEDRTATVLRMEEEHPSPYFGLTLTDSYQDGLSRFADLSADWGISVLPVAEGEFTTRNLNNWRDEQSGAVLLDEAVLAQSGLHLRAGRLPRAGEIVIPELMYQTFRQRGYEEWDPQQEWGEKISVTTTADLLGRNLYFFNPRGNAESQYFCFTMVGVLDTGYKRNSETESSTGPWDLHQKLFFAAEDFSSLAEYGEVRTAVAVGDLSAATRRALLDEGDERGFRYDNWSVRNWERGHSGWEYFFHFLYIGFALFVGILPLALFLAGTQTIREKQGTRFNALRDAGIAETSIFWVQFCEWRILWLTLHLLSVVCALLFLPLFGRMTLADRGYVPVVPPGPLAGLLIVLPLLFGLVIACFFGKKN